jgi:hypothetical protein
MIEEIMSKKLMCVFAHPDDESLGMGERWRNMPLKEPSLPW